MVQLQVQTTVPRHAPETALQASCELGTSCWRFHVARNSNFEVLSSGVPRAAQHDHGTFSVRDIAAECELRHVLHMITVLRCLNVLRHRGANRRSSLRSSGLVGTIVANGEDYRDVWQWHSAARPVCSTRIMYVTIPTLKTSWLSPPTTAVPR